eukprot:9876-Eustigmatos_ZCMA.PRE.1
MHLYLPRWAVEECAGAPKNVPWSAMSSQCRGTISWHNTSGYKCTQILSPIQNEESDTRPSTKYTATSLRVRTKPQHSSSQTTQHRSTY